MSSMNAKNNDNNGTIKTKRIQTMQRFLNSQFPDLGTTPKRNLLVTNLNLDTCFSALVYARNVVYNLSLSTMREVRVSNRKERV